jgi:site-specific recombinase XerD
VTDLICNTIDPTTVQEMLGHANLATTSRYLHLDFNDLNTAVNHTFDA